MVISIRKESIVSLVDKNTPNDIKKEHELNLSPILLQCDNGRSAEYFTIHTACIKAAHIRSVHMNKLSLCLNCHTVQGSCRNETFGTGRDAR